MPGYPVYEAALFLFYIFITCFALILFLIPLIFDKRPFSRSNATIAIFYTVAEKAIGSSNLKEQVVNN